MSSCSLLRNRRYENLLKIYSLGAAGKTFNVVSLCSSIGVDYTTLTADNFFFTPYSDSTTIVSGSGTWSSSCSPPGCWCESSTGQGSHVPSYANVKSIMTKSYNPTTGDLSCYYTVNSFVYLVLDSIALIEEGKILAITNGTNIGDLDPKGAPLAENKNFLYLTLTGYTDAIDCCAPRCPIYVQWSKSYDQTTTVIKSTIPTCRGGTKVAPGYYFSPKKFKYIE